MKILIDSSHFKDGSRITVDGVEYEIRKVLPTRCETCRYHHVAWDGRVVPNEACLFCINYDPINPYSTLMWKRKD